MDLTGRLHEAKPWNPRPEAQGGTTGETRQGVRPQATGANAREAMQRMQRKESKGMQKKAEERNGKEWKGKEGKERKRMQWKGMQWMEWMEWNGEEFYCILRRTPTTPPPGPATCDQRKQEPSQ